MRRVFAITIMVLLAIAVNQALFTSHAAYISEIERATTPQSTTSIQINGATRYQTIEGFGVNANSRSWDLANPGSFTPQLDTLVDDTGSSIWRVAIESHEDWEVTNDNADPNSFNWTYYNSLYETEKFQKLWAMLDYLDGKGVNTIMLSVMGCVPQWMGGCTLPDDGSMDDEWVEMISSMVYYARHTKQLRVDILSPINEHDMPNADSMEGPRITPAHYVAIMEKLSAKLDAVGMGDLRLIGPDLAGAERSATYLSALAAAPDVVAKFDHFAAHRYALTDGGLVGAIAASDYPNLTPWVTEYSGLCPNFKCDRGIPVTPDENWTFATDTFDYLQSYLNDGVTAALVWEAYDSYYEHHQTYTYWGMIGYDTGTGIYSPTKRLYVVQQTSRFIEAGMQRVDATSGDTNTVSISAFHNATTGKLTLVGRNKTSNPQTLSITVGGVGTPGALRLYQTSESLNMADGGSVSPSGSTYTVSLAAGSIFTLTNVPIPAPADTRSPTVTFTAPAEGATVSGANVQIAVSVSDNVGVAGVQFKLDGANLGVEQSASSPSLSWNSTGVVNGGHTFDAIARDAAGNTASATRSITVSNASYTSVQYLPLLEQ